MQERMEQMREVDGEQAYERMVRAVERQASRREPSQVSSREGAERSRAGAGLWTEPLSPCSCDPERRHPVVGRGQGGDGRENRAKIPDLGGGCLTI